MVRSLTHFVSTVMQEDISENDANGPMERAIKLFLSDITSLDEALEGTQRGKRKPLVLAKPNFISLLNLPLTISVYGSGRFYWEGSIRGEGILKIIKELFAGFRKGWAISTLTRFYQRWILQRLAEDGNQNEEESILQEGWYIKYNSREDLEQRLNQGLFVSGILFNNKDVVVYTNKDGLFKLVYGESSLLEDTNICFSGVRRIMGIGVSIAEVPKESITGYAALLPKFDGTGEIVLEPEPRWCTITSSWKHRDLEGRFVVPS